MLILFDQNTPVPIRYSLVGHSVRTANEQGWSTLENGDLLQVAEQNGFDVLLTADQNIAYQQKMEGRRIALVVLAKGQWPSIEPFVSQVVAAVEAAKPGTVTIVEIP
jgi:alkanesulfonate monooxygenase SsuD/methylene tetrahydromethanopterin reductase-like flavin-dependent oxidoreductase (luciferase family)